MINLLKKKRKVIISMFSGVLLLFVTFSVYSFVQADTGSACPPDETCGSSTVNVSGLSGITSSASATITVVGIDTATNAVKSESATITFQPAVPTSACPTTVPIASLLVDGATSTTTKPGEIVNYVWSAGQCTDSYSSTYSYTCSASSPGSGSWIANTVSGSSSGTISSSQANCTYTITYTARNSLNTTRPSASATVTVAVGAAPAVVTTTGSPTWVASNPTCIAGNKTTTYTCVDSITGQSATGCSPATKAPTTVSCSSVSSASCGSGTRTSTTQAPTEPNLCADGSVVASSPSLVGSSYQWSCGIPNQLGSSVTCSAPYTGSVAGACGNTINTEGGSYVPSLGGYDPLCSNGEASNLTSANNGVYSWSCSGTGTPAGSPVSCSQRSPEPISTCTRLDASADNVNIFSGGQTTLRWSSNCQFMRVYTTLAEYGQNRPRYLLCAGDSYGNYTGPSYLNNSCIVQPGNTTVGVGTYIVEAGDNDSSNGFNWLTTRLTKTITIGAANSDFWIKAVDLKDVSGRATQVVVYPGDTAKFRISIPFGTSKTVEGVTYTNPASFAGSPVFSLSNFKESIEDDRYTFPSTPDVPVYLQGGSYFPSLSGRDSGNYSYEGQVGTFSPLSLSSSENYTSILSVPIPSNAKPGTYHYTINANSSGAVRSARIIFWVMSGKNPQPLLSLNVAKTVGGSVASSDGGIGCGTVCLASYDKDTVVNLTATPDSASWKFLGWSGDCTGTSTTCSVTMSKSKSVSARFAPKPLDYREF